MSVPETRSVALVTLGCTRNDVDSEELAGRLAREGWTLVDDAAEADVAVVNTCGFIEQAKKDSIDALLEAGDLRDDGRTQAVVAVGCLAERYGQELADELPEVDAVLGFDSYTQMSAHLRAVLDGDPPPSHVPSDRRRLLPISPLERADASVAVALPGHGDDGADAAASGDSAAERDLPRARLDDKPWAPLKIASGCDRRCAFCAIPMFRGAFVSRRPHDVLAEARWLAEQGVSELFLVSENSTSYGKDLGDLDLLASMLPELVAIPGVEMVRVSYLQPAEIRPGLLEAMAATPGVAPWYDLSFQHASEPLLRRMRRFGSAEAFLALIEQIRERQPQAAIRSNVILGFPGETEDDVEILVDFLTRARLDVVGVFGYSDEDGTEGENLDSKVDADVIAERVDRVSRLVEELTAQRAEERVGESITVLVEEIDEETGFVSGRAEHQGPDVDGATLLEDADDVAVGQRVRATVVATDGIDLIAEVAR